MSHVNLLCLSFEDTFDDHQKQYDAVVPMVLLFSIRPTIWHLRVAQIRISFVSMNLMVNAHIAYTITLHVNDPL